MKKTTLNAILKALARGDTPKQIAKRMKGVRNTQQIGAIITNVGRGIYDTEYPALSRKIRYMW